MSPPCDFSQKSINELISLLDDKDGTNRACAAVFLGLHYKNPSIIRPGEPILKENSVKSELPAVNVIVKTLEHRLQVDPNLDVKLCIIDSLGNIRFRTNTCPILLGGLSDSSAIVRIRAAQTLIDNTNTYDDPLDMKVIATLTSLLDSQRPPEEIWQAAWSLGKAKYRATAALPKLRQLRKHPSAKVRFYAEQAVKEISTRE